MEHNALWTTLRARLSGWKPALPTIVRATSIGFDLASERLNLAQVAPHGKAWRWRAAAAIDYPDGRTELLRNPAAFRSLVQDALRRHGFRGRQVVSVLPPDDLQVISIDYSTPNGQDDTATLLRTLRERFKGGLDDAVVDILPIRRPPESNLRSAVVAVAQRDKVIAHLDLLTSAGLEPQAVDIGPAALARLARAVVTGDPRANLLLINFGLENTYLSLLWGRRLMFDRSLAFGEKRLATTLSRNLDLPPARALDLLRRHGLHNPTSSNSPTRSIAYSSTSPPRPMAEPWTAFTWLAASPATPALPNTSAACWPCPCTSSTPGSCPAATRTKSSTPLPAWP